MNQFSSNGDGKDRTPNNRISSHLDGQRPAHPDNQHEQLTIQALTDRYDQIEALWNEAEDDLKRFRVPYPIEYCYDTDSDHGPTVEYALCWMRYGKAWRICHLTRTRYSDFDDTRED